MRFALIALAAVLGLVAVLVATLPWLAEPALRAGLRLAALDNVDFERLRLGWGDLELEGVMLGHADQELGRLRVVYGLPELLQGRLERVEIDGLVVRAAWRDGRLHLAGIASSDETDEESVPPLPDVGDLVLRDARLELSTDLGTLQLPLSAEIRSLGERLSFDATIENARLDGIEGAIHGNVAVSGDLPRDAPITIEAMQAKGIMAMVAEDATLGTAREIGGHANVGFDLAQRELQVETSDVGFRLDGLAVSGMSILQRLHWNYASGVWTFRASEAGALGIDHLVGEDLRAGPLRLRLEPTDRPLLELTLGGAMPTAWRHSISAAIDALDVRIGAVPFQSRAGTVTLAAEGRPSLSHAEISLDGGAIRLPEHALALDGIATEVALTATSLAPDQQIPVTIGRISHGGRPAWFAPLGLQAELAPDAAGIAFEGEVSRIGGGLRLGLHGRERGGEVAAAIDVAPVNFGPDLQPKDLAPIAGDLLGDVAGQLALRGDLTWSAGGLAGDLAILAEELGLTVGPARLEQVNGVIRLDRLWPPTTPPGQQLAVGLLDLGLPLTAGITTFQLVPGPRLDIAQLEWGFAGGMARAEPFSLGSGLEGANVILRAEQLDLGQLLALTRLDGLTGEGSLDGVLPVRLTEGAAIIEGGELAATKAGVLRYDAGKAPAALQAGGEGVDLLLQALENFHYEALRITLDGRTDATMDIGLHVGGANPDLYGGHPIEFNLNLEGELGNILRQGVNSYQIPDRVRERMQGFER